MAYQIDGIKYAKGGGRTLNTHMCVQGKRGVKKLVIRCICTNWMAPYSGFGRKKA